MNCQVTRGINRDVIPDRQNMNGRAIASLFALVCLLLPLSTLAQSGFPLPTPTYGWNMGNTMEPPCGEGCWGGVASQPLINAAAAAGFNAVRIPVASLSGGQRQTVAIARSLLGDPKVVILDEPTAALGVAQTAEVLNLVERLRENGHGVLMISHNMADVKAVADRVAVLRLGRNNGVFDAGSVSSEEIVAAITGATDNVVSQRAARRAAPSSATSSQEEQE